MSKQFEALFKDLANGMSRRAALRRFLGGIAGAATFALTGRPARADSPGVCGQWCSSQYAGFPRAGLWIAACIETSNQCPPGFCASSGDLSWAQTQGDDPRPHFNSWVCVAAQ
jgi:hypothetical protein